MLSHPHLPTREEKYREEPPPNLQTLLFILESANSKPALAAEYLKDLQSDVDDVITKVHLLDPHFLEGLRGTQ